MKRALFGILWFIISWIVLTIIFGIVSGIVFSMGHHAASGYAQGVQAMRAFTQTHHGLVATIRIIILILAILIAVVGTWKGFLPGTKKKASPIEGTGAKSV